MTVSAATARDNGTYILIDIPGAEATAPEAINSDGVIAGFWEDNTGVFRGFVRSSDGTITEFDPPDTIDTEPLAINDKGWIAGKWTDSHSVQRGFIRKPDDRLVTIFVGKWTEITKNPATLTL